MCIIYMYRMCNFTIFIVEAIFLGRRNAVGNKLRLMRPKWLDTRILAICNWIEGPLPDIFLNVLLAMKFVNCEMIRCRIPFVGAILLRPQDAPTIMAFMKSMCLMIRIACCSFSSPPDNFAAVNVERRILYKWRIMLAGAVMRRFVIHWMVKDVSMYT